MKFNKLFTALTIVVAGFACEPLNNDILVGGDGDADLSGRQFANIDPTTTVNFLYQNTTSVSIPLNKFESESSTIDNVVITKTLNIADLDNDPETTDPVSSAPVSYTLTGDEFAQSLSELFADVPINGTVFNEDSLAPGDSWTLEYVVNLSGAAPTDEGILDIGVSTNILFACVSAIPTEGTWTGETQNGAFANFSTNDDVTLTKLDDSGNYNMSDITGGFYAAFGFNTNQPGNFNDLCNIINVTTTPDAQFNIVTAATPGFWDSETGELLVTWYDAGNDIDEATLHTRN